MQQKTVTLLSSIGVLLVTIIWGFAFVVVKNGLDLVPPIWMVAFRFSIAGVLLALVFFKKLRALTKSELLHGTIIGLWLFGAYVTQTYGCKYTTAGKNAFLTTFYVILVPFINWIVVRKRPDGYTLVAAVLSIIGIGLLSLTGSVSAAGSGTANFANLISSVNKGDVYTLFCGLFYALQMVDIARYSQRDDPITLAVLQMLVTALLAWLLAPIVEGPLPAAAFTDRTSLGGLLYLGLLSTMLAYLLQNLCQKFLPPATAALLMSFESVFGMLFSCLFLAERLTPRAFVGCVLMFAAVVLSETKLEFLRGRERGKK